MPGLCWHQEGPGKGSREGLHGGRLRAGSVCPLPPSRQAQSQRWGSAAPPDLGQTQEEVAV